MRAVNLLPRESRSQRSVTAQNLPAVVGGGMGFLVVAVLAAGYLSASSKVAGAQKDLDAANAQLAQTPVPAATQPAAPVNPTPPAVAAEQAPRLQAVSAALSQRIAWDRILREFSLVLPSDVWISSLSMSTPTVAGGNGFTIAGSTYSYDSVARMLTRMSLIPDLSGVTLQSTSGNGNLVQFGLAASIKGAALPPAPAPAPAPVTTDTTSTDGSGSGT
jgi:Tfp pilus assembly protein PilN